MKQPLSVQKKPSARTTESFDQKLLVSRHEAALRLSSASVPSIISSRISKSLPDELAPSPNCGNGATAIFP